MRSNQPPADHDDRGDATGASRDASSHSETINEAIKDYFGKSGYIAALQAFQADLNARPTRVSSGTEPGTGASDASISGLIRDASSLA